MLSNGTIHKCSPLHPEAPRRPMTSLVLHFTVYRNHILSKNLCKVLNRQLILSCPRRLRLTWMDSRIILPLRRIAEFPGDYGTHRTRGGEARTRRVHQDGGQGFILEPTTNRPTQAILINRGLMNINQEFIRETNQSMSS